MQPVPSLLCFVLLAAPLSAQESAPITFRVQLPSDAVLEIDGYRTTSQGNSREFQTPSIAVGKKYAYVLKAVADGRTVTRTVYLEHAKQTVVDLTAEFAKPAPMTGADPKPMAEPPKKTFTKGPARAGFVSYIVDGRLWVFKDKSKELADFEKSGPSDKHITRIGGGPSGMTVKAPDAETLDAYLKALMDKK